MEGAGVAGRNEKFPGGRDRCDGTIGRRKALPGRAGFDGESGVAPCGIDSERQDAIGENLDRAVDGVGESVLGLPLASAPISDFSSAMVTLERKSVCPLARRATRARHRRARASLLRTRRWCRAGSFQAHRLGRGLVAGLVEAGYVLIGQAELAAALRARCRGAGPGAPRFRVCRAFPPRRCDRAAPLAP